MFCSARSYFESLGIADGQAAFDNAVDVCNLDVSGVEGSCVEVNGVFRIGSRPLIRACTDLRCSLGYTWSWSSHSAAHIQLCSTLSTVNLCSSSSSHLSKSINYAVHGPLQRCTKPPKPLNKSGISGLS